LRITDEALNAFKIVKYYDRINQDVENPGNSSSKGFHCTAFEDEMNLSYIKSMTVHGK
jgi:hypothetical protein